MSSVRIGNFCAEMVKRMRREGEMGHKGKMKGDIRGMEQMRSRFHSSLGGIQVFPVQPEVSYKAMSGMMGLDIVGVLSCSVQPIQHHAVTHLQQCMFPRSL